MCLLAEIMQPGFAHKLLLISPAGLESFSTTEIHIIETSLNLASMIQGIRAPKHTSSFLKEHAHIPKSKTMHAYVSSMLRRPVNELLHMVKCKVQIYFGDHDVLIPNRLFRMESAVAYAKRTVAELPNFTVYKLPDAGHWPMLENPKGLIKLMQDHNPELK